MIEPSRTTLYRNILAASAGVLIVLWISFGLHGYGVIALTWITLILVARHLAQRGVAGLQVRRSLYPSAFETDTVDVRLTLENRGMHDAHFIELADRFGPSLVDRQIIAEAGPFPGRAWRELYYIGLCTRRWGSYEVGPLTVSTGDPLGLASAEKRIQDVDFFSVFPQVYELPELHQEGGSLSLTPQESVSDYPGQSQLYLGVRDYRSGDEPRRIHWPATARRGTLVVKEFEVDLVPYFTLFLDLNREHRAGTGRKSTLEFVVRTGSSLLWTAVQKRQFVQIFGDDGEPLIVDPGTGERHLTYALHHLIQVQQDGRSTLPDVVERSAAALPTGSVAALLYATSTPDLGELRRICESLGARAVQPLFVFINGHSFAPVDRWPLPPEEVEERHREIGFFLRSRAIPHVFFDADDDLRELLPNLELER